MMMTIVSLSLRPDCDLKTEHVIMSWYCQRDWCEWLGDFEMLIYLDICMVAVGSIELIQFD
jgi:hypothetical protein